MIWIINAVLVYVISYALTIRYRLQYLEEKEAKIKAIEEMEVEIFRVNMEKDKLKKKYQELQQSIITEETI